MTESKAIKILRSRTPADKIISIDKYGNFYEITARAGGDVLTYRVYENGTVTER